MYRAMDTLKGRWKRQAFSLALLLLLMAPSPPGLRLRCMLPAPANVELNDAMFRFLQEQLGDSIRVMPLHSRNTATQPDPDRSVIVSLGPTRLRRAANDPPDLPVLALFITAEQYDNLAHDSPARTSALYYDPPLLRQALLGKLIFPQAERLAVLSSPGYRDQFRALQPRLQRVQPATSAVPVGIGRHPGQHPAPGPWITATSCWVRQIPWCTTAPPSNISC